MNHKQHYHANYTYMYMGLSMFSAPKHTHTHLFQKEKQYFKKFCPMLDKAYFCQYEIARIQSTPRVCILPNYLLSLIVAMLFFYCEY